MIVSTHGNELGSSYEKKVSITDWEPDSSGATNAAHGLFPHAAGGHVVQKVFVNGFQGLCWHLLQPESKIRKRTRF